MKPLPHPKVRSGPAEPAGRERLPRRGWLTGQPSRGLQRLGLRLAGAGLLAATGAIHLDLYLTGYRPVPVIGWLFLLQVIAAFGLAAAGAGFALATLGGYLLSVWIGLFGFKEIRTTAGIAAGVIEAAAFAALAAVAAAPATPGQQGAARQASRGGRLLARVQAGVPGAGRAVAGISLAALLVLGISVAQAAGPAPAPASSGRAVLKAAKIGGVTVLTSARGFTLYWFAPDTPTRSACHETCAGYWPPVTGTPLAAPGVTGKLGTIKRSDGTTQVTYNGHPLYTYVGDTAPGQAFGNNLNLNGGLWHEMTVSG